MSQFMFTKSSFSKAMASRIGFKKEDAQAGKKFKMTIRGNGTTVNVLDKTGKVVADADGVVLEKRIFNTNANSATAMQNPANTQLYKDACAAEKAGDAEKAHALFNTLANNLNVSFNILLPNRIADSLTHNTEISANLQLVEVPLKDADGKPTAAKGYIITIDEKTIRVMEPEVAGSLSLPGGWDDEDVVATTSPVTAPAALKEA